jgi:UDP-galactopyranose mutase
VKVVVVGAGFTGACAARMLRESLDAEVTVLEHADVPGGMLRTLATRDGVPYEYGPRVVSVFRGTADALDFVRRFVELAPRTIYQGTRLRPDYPVIPFPVDLESIRQLPCGARIDRELADLRAAGQPPAEGSLRDYLESSVGPTLTELAFAGFNEKFWGRRLEDMPAEWGKLRRLERVAERGDYRLPSVAPHHYPVGGFNPLFDRMLEDVTVHYGARAERIERDGAVSTVYTEHGRHAADLVIATGPIDEMLAYRFGPLEWRGYRVEPEVVAPEHAARLGVAPDGVPFAWTYTPWVETPVARTTDFGVIHHGDPVRAGVPSVILREIVDDSVRMYPVWWEDDRFQRYLRHATATPGVIPLGRLGLYKYVTIDTTYELVRRMVERLERYLATDAAGRYELMREVRGDWDN